MDYEQVKAIIEVRLSQWERAYEEAIEHADSLVIREFEASATAARIILADLEMAHKAEEAK